MYRELLFFPEKAAGTRFSSDEARAIVSRALANFPAHPALFGRDESGKTLQGVYGHANDGEGYGRPPLVTYGGGHGLIRVTGLGRTGADIVGQSATLIATALNAHFGGVSRIKLNEGQHKIERKGLHLYKIHDLCLAKQSSRNPGAIDRLSRDGQFTLEGAEPAIRRAVVGGLVSMARFLDEDGGDDQRLEFNLPRDEDMGFRILSARRPMFRRISEKTTPLFVGRLEFSLNVRLSGPFYAGKLRGYGFGHLASPSRPGDVE